MAVIYGVLLVIVAQISTSLALPKCACARNFRQVCGSDGKTYTNPCVLRCVSAKADVPITIVERGPCKLAVPSECVCTFNYQPVCGNDGETYSNECLLRCHKARFNKLLDVEHSGPCIPHDEPANFCAAVYSPICGSDGNTYGNECMFNSAMSKNPDLKRLYNGPCDNRVKDI